MARCEKIFIAGFSGSGKSMLLEALEKTQETPWNYVDLDQQILKENPAFSQLKNLIEAYGWEKFRLLERQGIEKFLKDKDRGVMALGGGAFTPLIWQLYGNHPKIKFCYLYSSFEDCWDRLINDPEEPRPLALRGKEVLRSLYEERLATYQLIPWKIKNPQGRSPEELALEFWDGLQ